MHLWRKHYNEAMAAVDNAAWLSETEMKKILKEGSAYFVHRNGALLGIGKVSADQIDAVAAVVRGAGADVVRALASVLTGDSVAVEVAQTNCRALSLYERLGFVATKELSRWYQIFESDK